MRSVLVIGIGPGDPEQITVQAIRALNRAEVAFVVEKGSDADRLADARREILARYAQDGRGPRVVAVADPPRDRGAAAYRAAVEDWRRRRAEVWERAIAAELAEDGCGAFLVWGDPALYDSTIAVLDRIRARGRVQFEYEVIPGISAAQALAARHRVSLTRIGGSVQITTGRRLAEGLPDGADDVLVMLDGAGTLSRLAEAEELEVYWGAYVGTPEELLLRGRLREVAGEVERLRFKARERNGWIMDCYLLRRPSSAERPPRS